MIMDKLNNSCDSEIVRMLDLFKNIKLSDIPFMELPKIKKRSLNPLVNNKRLYN